MGTTNVGLGGFHEIVGEYQLPWGGEICSFYDSARGGQWQPDSATGNLPAAAIVTIPATNAGSPYTGKVDLIVPLWFDANKHTLTLRVRAACYQRQANTTHNLDVEALPDGTGSDICSTSAQNLTSTSYADFDFVLAPAGRSPGDHIVCHVTSDLDDSGGGGADPGTRISNVTLVIGLQ